MSTALDCWNILLKEDPGWIEEYREFIAWGKDHDWAYPASIEYATDEESQKIYNWIHAQKNFYRRGIPTKFKFEKLTVLSGLEKWDWGSEGGTEWDEGFIRYRGNPTSTRRKFWAKAQKIANKRGFLTDRKIMALKNLPGWTWDITPVMPKNKVEEKKVEEKIISPIDLINEELSGSTNPWYSNYKKLLDWQKIYPDRLPRQDENAKLYNWISNNRYDFLKRDTPTRHQRAMLLSQTIDAWDWAGLSEGWKANYICYRDNLPELQNSLKRKWVEVQRKYRNSGYISQDKLEKLDELPGWSWEHGVDVTYDTNYPEKVTEPVPEEVIETVPKKRKLVLISERVLVPKRKVEFDPEEVPKRKKETINGPITYPKCYQCKECPLSEQEGVPSLRLLKEAKAGALFCELKFICMECSISNYRSNNPED